MAAKTNRKANGIAKKNGALRVLVVGVGNMGASHARAYDKIEGFELAGLCARRIAKRTDLPARWSNVPRFADYGRAASSIGRHATEVKPVWEAAFAHRTREELVDLFKSVGGDAVPIMDYPSLLAHPQIAARHSGQEETGGIFLLEFLSDYFWKFTHADADRRDSGDRRRPDSVFHGLSIRGSGRSGRVVRPCQYQRAGPGQDRAIE